MRNISMDNYRFYISNKNEIIAVSTFAGKSVRGVAKCNPDDEFSLADGKALAMARCNEKIAERRLRRAKEKIAESRSAYEYAKRTHEKMKNYLLDSDKEYAEAKKNVESILAKIG